jgi:hypothetical protein
MLRAKWNSIGPATHGAGESGLMSFNNGSLWRRLSLIPILGNYNSPGRITVSDILALYQAVNLRERSAMREEAYLGRQRGSQRDEDLQWIYEGSRVYGFLTLAMLLAKWSSIGPATHGAGESGLMSFNNGSLW